jgi:hypothetical protein
MIKNRHCARCGCTTRQEISCRIVANGVEHFGWWCLECRGWVQSKSGGIWIDKATLEDNGVDLSLAPVVDRLDQPRCARCGARGAEEHHWAPRALFGKDEADRWPKDYLCKECHARWHRMVTPALVRGEAY